jgi:hypothetical protein
MGGKTLLKAAIQGSFLFDRMVCTVELSIRWNEIRGVQSLDSVSQLVPFIVAVGQLAHVIYNAARGKDSIKRVISANESDEVPDLQKDGKQPRCKSTTLRRSMISE